MVLVKVDCMIFNPGEQVKLCQRCQLLVIELSSGSKGKMVAVSMYLFIYIRYHEEGILAHYKNQNIFLFLTFFKFDGGPLLHFIVDFMMIPLIK